jgi:phosphatidylinositol alpha-mannosyltransferase
VRVGLVCPYSLDTPGGVQHHVRGLAEALLSRGHDVSVLAPGGGAGLPSYVVPAGRAVAVPYNGSVARLSFGPVVSARARRWLREGAFDVVHVHEPATPSLSLLALWAAECPVVATYHASSDRSRALSASAALLRPALEKVAARIAVSEHARDTQVRHVGGEPVVIPNGLDVDAVAAVQPDPALRGSAGTVAFVGRLGEPRKGFPVLVEAFAEVAARRPGTRLLVVGGGEVEASRADLPGSLHAHVDLLGQVSERRKSTVLRTADVLVAPNTGGESFGVVLTEAMAAGAAVLASDLPAFRRVLEDGGCGELFRTGDAVDLAVHLQGLLEDPARRATLAGAAAAVVRRYDWATVAEQVLRVYETVVEGRR